jgi:glycine cleavage system regulatory protein
MGENTMRRFIPAFLILALIACAKQYKSTAKLAVDEQSSAGARAMNVASLPPPPQREALQRMIIRSANISMIVDDTAGSIDKITAAAESVGGYVSDSKVWRDGEQLRGSITLRVPTDRLSAALAVVRKLAVRIDSETIGSQDATQEYVDLESQLRNLEVTEVELRQLMTTIRQNSKKASEVLEIYQQLSTIRSQIEQIKGRMRYLSQMTSFASMQIDLVPNALAKPVVEPGWQPLVIVKDASRSLVGALQSFAAAAIWLGIYVLPILLILGLIAFGAWRVITVTWKTRRSPSL